MRIRNFQVHQVHQQYWLHGSDPFKLSQRPCMRLDRLPQPVSSPKPDMLLGRHHGQQPLPGKHGHARELRRMLLRHGPCAGLLPRYSGPVQRAAGLGRRALLRIRHVQRPAALLRPWRSRRDGRDDDGGGSCAGYLRGFSIGADDRRDAYSLGHLVSSI